ncbi:uncharacterized protein LOC128204840 [Mya arenaria]|nr:uncharacterized protein LOC128204840 [Mya arenaria]
MAEVKQSPRLVSLGLTSPQVREVITRYVQQYMNVCTFRPTAGTVKAPVTLIRGRQNQKGSKMPGDYGLSKVYEGGVAVHILNTPHGTVLQKMADEVMATINATVEKAKTAG